MTNEAYEEFLAKLLKPKKKRETIIKRDSLREREKKLKKILNPLKVKLKLLDTIIIRII